MHIVEYKVNKHTTRSRKIVIQPYWWADITEYVRSFTHSCIECLVFRAKDRMLRSMSDALHSLEPNKVVNTYFVYKPPAADCYLKNLLKMKYDTSSNTWLHACAAAGIGVSIRLFDGVLIFDSWNCW